MSKGWKGLAVAVALAAALPAWAAVPHGSGGGVLRLGIGFEGMGSRGYSCAYDVLGRYVCGNYGAVSALLLGGDYDIPGRGILGPQSQFTVGLRLVAGGRHYYYYAYDTQTYLEPTGGVVWKFSTASPVLEPRLEAGLGLYLGPQVGLALRGGGGIAFRLTPAVSLGLDLMVELGVLGGYGFSALQFMVGPEFKI